MKWKKMNRKGLEKKMVPVILSGGSGTRLWPVSRRAHPKPFMKLVDGESLAEKTFRRALGVAGKGPVLTVTNRDYFFYTRDLYEGLDSQHHEHPFLLVLTDNIHIDEIVEFMRKGPLDDAIDAIVHRALRRMAVESKTLPSKPDDLSLILFRKP